MITITLEEPNAWETLYALQMESARAVGQAASCVERKLPESAVLHSQRAEKLLKVSNVLQRAILLQRGITEP